MTSNTLYRVNPADGVTVQVKQGGAWKTFRKCATPGQAHSLLAQLRAKETVK